MPKLIAEILFTNIDINFKSNLKLQIKINSRDCLFIIQNLTLKYNITNFFYFDTTKIKYQTWNYLYTLNEMKLNMFLA